MPKASRTRGTGGSRGDQGGLRSNCNFRHAGAQLFRRAEIHRGQWAAFATSPNAKTILFPVEATQLIGSLGGIGELVRDSFGDKRV